MLRTDFARWIAKLVTLCLVSAAHGADKFPDYPVRSASDYPVKAEKAGLVVGVQPVEDLKEQETYFHTKLTPKGFLPVFIVIQNGTNAESFLFDKTKITLSSADSRGAGPQVHSKAGEVTAVASLAAISIVGMVVAVKLITGATNVQQNILKKEVQSKTLSPGQSAHGFLYVSMPKGTPRGMIRLTVPITRAGSDETSVLDLVF